MKDAGRRKMDRFISQQEEKPLDTESWLDKEDWLSVQLDQIKLMISDEEGDRIDLDQALGFNEDSVEAEVERWDGDLDIPSFASKQPQPRRETPRRREPSPLSGDPELAEILALLGDEPDRPGRPIAPEFDATEGERMPVGTSGRRPQPPAVPAEKHGKKTPPRFSEKSRKQAAPAPEQRPHRLPVITETPEPAPVPEAPAVQKKEKGVGLLIFLIVLEILGIVGVSVWWLLWAL